MDRADTIEQQPWMTAQATTQVVAALTAQGQNVRFVGGCVRDAILGRVIKDIDLATPDPPETVSELLKVAGISAIPTGIAHGTITAVADHQHFEITTLRRDAVTFGRHAQVEYVDDWRIDAERRDLTINAIYCNPDGKLYDPTGGRADLAAGRIRFVGDPEVRIREDYLRILRFFRFLAWYGRSTRDDAAVQSCARLAPEMSVLAGERVASELLGMLAAPDPVPVFELMIRHEILAALTPELRDVDRLRALCGFDRAVGLVDPLRRFSSLIAGNAETVTTIGDRLNLSNQQRRRLLNATRTDDLVSVNMDRKAARAALYRLGNETFADLALLAFADQGGDITWNTQRAKKLLAYAGSWLVSPMPISGQDLLALGFPEGPDLGRLLTALDTWWVENDFAPDRNAMLARAVQLRDLD